MQETGRRTDDAKQFVRHLFEMGGTDADTATACLLALDRRAKETGFSGKVVQRRRKGDWKRGAVRRKGDGATAVAPLPPPPAVS
jgi:hypothetical protein